MSEPVLVSVEDGLCHVTLARPDAGNAVTPAMIRSLADAATLAERDDVRAVLIDAQGGNFCVGADLRHLRNGDGPLPQRLDAMAIDFHAMLLRLASLPVPVVAAVQGNAVGAGFGLMLAADVVVAAENARVATGYAKLGLSADAGVSYFLARTVGPRLARSLLMTARTIGAPQAAAWGLIDTLVAEETLAAEARAMARTLASGPTHAFAAIKRLVADADAGNGLGAHLDRERAEIVALAGSDFAAAAIARMLQR